MSWILAFMSRQSAKNTSDDEISIVIFTCQVPSSGAENSWNIYSFCPLHDGNNAWTQFAVCWNLSSGAPKNSHHKKWKSGRGKAVFVDWAETEHTIGNFERKKSRAKISEAPGGSSRQGLWAVKVAVEWICVKVSIFSFCLFMMAIFWSSGKLVPADGESGPTGITIM